MRDEATEKIASTKKQTTPLEQNEQVGELHEATEMENNEEVTPQIENAREVEEEPVADILEEAKEEQEPEEQTSIASDESEEQVDQKTSKETNQSDSSESFDEPRVQANRTSPEDQIREIPEEIKRWNWGAFSLNIVWGIGNKAYLTLLCLIPIFNLVWIFICGIKGNEWAWENGNYKDVEEFKKIQQSWNRAGIAMFIIQITIIVLYLLFLAFIFIAISRLFYNPWYYY